MTFGIGNRNVRAPQSEGSLPSGSTELQPLVRELELAATLARRAGRVLLDYLAGPFEVGHKGRGELVTPADRASDQLICRGLRSGFPADAIYSEETPDTPDRLTRSRVWIVDPLDGTSDFVGRGDGFCVSIGLAIDGEALLGVVYNPRRDELIAGYCGAGVSLNGRPVAVASAERLEEARLLVSRKELNRGIGDLSEVLAPTPVASMAYKLARVAAGLDDGVFSLKCRKEWGLCAGTALVRAAGGEVRLLDGQTPRFNRAELQQPTGLVAAGPALMPALLFAVQQGA